eukprot:3667433-Pyramimonas_sp.AAC.1
MVERAPVPRRPREEGARLVHQRWVERSNPLRIPTPAHIGARNSTPSVRAVAGYAEDVVTKASGKRHVDIPSDLGHYPVVLHEDQELALGQDCTSVV